MKKLLLVLWTAGAVILAGGCCFSDGLKPTAETFAVNNVYGSHMVLQRQKPIQIAGTAEAGKAVKVTIGENSTVAAAGKDGVWKAVLPAMEAGGPYTVTVSGAEGSKPIVFTDVLIGEVWFCSGQSNMAMMVGRCNNGRQEIAAANYPDIRIFQVSNTVSMLREETAVRSAKGWQVCSPETIGRFSACAYYFGRELHKDLNVPIGLINSSWGGTRIQPWISKPAYEAAKRKVELSEISFMKKESEESHLKKSERTSYAGLKKWLDRFYGKHAAETAAAADWMKTDLDTSGWKKFKMPGRFAGAGASWFRREVEVPANWAGKDLQLSLSLLEDFDETYFNGEKVGGSWILSEKPEKGPRSYTVPGKLVRAGKNVIAIRITSIYGHGTVGLRSRQMFLANGKQKIKLDGTWLTRSEFSTRLHKFAPLPHLVFYYRNTSQFPSGLYNAMVNPWTVYPVRGFLWYQGCSNTGNPGNYMTLHPLLIQDWRNRWNDQNMPFIFAQLAAFERHTPKKRLSMDMLKAKEPGKSNSAALREVQAATLKIPLTGMGVAIDIGDHSDVHPTNKQDLAYRLAQEAKRVAYGYKGITAGPMFRSMKVKDGKACIEFTNVGKGLKVKGDKLNCFAIAGKDGKFVWANAKVEGNTVVVWADTVKEPVDVRYAWAGFPVDPNLYNQEGFPAVPFRTDRPDYLLK